MKYKLYLSLLIAMLTPTVIYSVSLDLDNKIMEYKQTTDPYQETEDDKMYEILNDINSMKESGEWNLSGIQLDTTKSKIPDYQTIEGKTIDQTIIPGKIVKGHFKSTGAIEPFLKQPLSARQRLMLMSAAFMVGWDYGDRNRDKPFSGITDCSGSCTLIGKTSGLRVNTFNTRNIHKNPALFQVSKNNLEPADILWKPGHVTFFIGRDSNGEPWVVNAPTWGRKVEIKKVSKKYFNKFTKVYRYKGRDNPLTQEELSIIGGYN